MAKRTASAPPTATPPPGGASVPTPRKRQRQHGLCICACCSARSSEVAWAHAGIHRKTGGPEPVDDKCEKCWRRFKAGFQQYLDWEQFCQFAAQPTASDALDSVTNFLEGKSMGFIGADVGEGRECGVEVQRHVLLLGPGEFAKFMGSRPHSRMPKIHVIRLPKDDQPDVLEDNSVFQDPNNPHKTAKLFQRFSCSSMRGHLAATAQSHPSQADKTFQRIARDRAQASNEASIFGSRLQSLEEYRECFQIQRTKQLAERPAAKPAGAEADGDGYCMVDGSDSDGSSDSGSSDSPPRARSSGLADGLQTPTKGSFAPDGVSEFGRWSGPAKSATIASTLQPPSSFRSASTASLAEAVGGGDNGGREDDRKKAGRPGNDPEYYIEALSLKEIINGRKLGVQEDHAERLLRKMDKDDPSRARLSLHLEKVMLAKNLTQSCLPNLPDADLARALEEVVKKYDLPAPAHLQEHLLARAQKNSIKEAFASKSLSAYLRVVAPWPVQDAGFDVESPLLAAMSMEKHEKCKAFVASLFRDILIPAVRRGEQGKDTTLELTNQMLDFLSDMLHQDEEMSDTSMKRLLEVVDSCRCVRALASASMEHLVHSTTELQAMHMAAGTACRSWQAQLANEVSREAWYASKLTAALAGASVASSAVEGMAAHKERMDTLQGSLMHRLESMAEICKDVSTWEATLNPEAFKDFKGEVQQAINIVTCELKSDMQQTIHTTSDALKAQSALLDFSMAFPQMSDLQEVLSAVCQHMTRHKAEGAIDSLIKACDAFTRVVSKGQTIDGKHFAVLEALRKCEGMYTDEGDKLVTVGDNLTVWLLGVGVASMGDAKVLAEVCEGVLPFCDPQRRDEFKPQCQIAIRYCDLAEAVSKWEREASLLQDMVGKGALDLTGLRRLQSARQGLLELDCSKHASLSEQAEQLLAKADKLIDEASKFILAYYEGKVTTSSGELATLLKAATTADGSDWRTVLQKHTWKEYASVAAEYLARLDPARVAALCREVDGDSETYKSEARSFGLDPDGCSALQEAHALLHKAQLETATGSLVALLTGQLDKVGLLRALRSQMATFKKCGIDGHLDPILAAQVERNVKFS